MDEIPSELNSVPSYYFETPDSDPDPELLKLLPEKSLFEQVLDFGLYFVAAFQIICFLAVIFLRDPAEAEEAPQNTPKKATKESKKQK